MDCRILPGVSFQFINILVITCMSGSIKESQRKLAGSNVFFLARVYGIKIERNVILFFFVLSPFFFFVLFSIVGFFIPQSDFEAFRNKSEKRTHFKARFSEIQSYNYVSLKKVINTLSRLSALFQTEIFKVDENNKCLNVL